MPRRSNGPSASSANKHGCDTTKEEAEDLGKRRSLRWQQRRHCSRHRPNPFPKTPRRRCGLEREVCVESTPPAVSPGNWSKTAALAERPSGTPVLPPFLRRRPVSAHFVSSCSVPIERRSLISGETLSATDRRPPLPPPPPSPRRRLGNSRAFFFDAERSTRSSLFNLHEGGRSGVAQWCGFRAGIPGPRGERQVPLRNGRRSGREGVGVASRGQDAFKNDRLRVIRAGSREMSDDTRMPFVRPFGVSLSRGREPPR